MPAGGRRLLKPVSGGKAGGPSSPDYGSEDTGTEHALFHGMYRSYGKLTIHLLAILVGFRVGPLKSGQ